jgi:hypothetical protein
MEPAAGPADDAGPEDHRHRIDLDQVGRAEELGDLLVLADQVQAVEVVVGDHGAFPRGDLAGHEVEDFLGAHQVHRAAQNLHALFRAAVQTESSDAPLERSVPRWKKHLDRTPTTWSTGLQEQT